MSKKILITLLVIIALVMVLGIFWWQQSIEKKIKSETKVYHVGLLQMAPTVAENMDGFKIGMAELGLKEGINIKYTYRDAEGDLEKLEKFAQELVALKPDLIFVNTSPATAIIKKATEGTDIPVVFSMVADPLRAGFIKTIESSGNNLTGTGCAYIAIAPKRLEILKEISPDAKKVLIFYRPEDLSGGPATQSILEKAPEIGIKVISVPIEKKEDVRDYLATLKPGEIDAIMDPADSMATVGLTEWGISKANELKVPLMMLSKGECEKGALACFGVDYIDLGKQSSLMANQILMGIEPTNIPTETPRKFLFVINLKTASAIGLEIPEGVLHKADIIIK
jgi:putative ABC transport system substrate-binding protein